MSFLFRDKEREKREEGDRIRESDENKKKMERMRKYDEREREIEKEVLEINNKLVPNIKKKIKTFISKY